MRVLYVAWEFPPIKTIGRIRSNKFVHHLLEDGFDLVVLTIEAHEGIDGFDSSLLREVPYGVPIVRARNPTLELIVANTAKRVLKPARTRRESREVTQSEPPEAPVHSGMPTAEAAAPTGLRRLVQQRGIDAFKWVLHNWVDIPDPFWPWASIALKQAERLHAEKAFDLVLTSLPPFSAARIGYQMKLRHGVPWVMDYRDLWYGDVLREWVGPLRRRYELVYERTYLRAADVVIGVSEQKTDFLRKLQPRSQARFVTLTNGYDPEVYNSLLAEPRTPHDTVDFVFTGRLFKNRRGYAFAEALGQLARERPALVRNVRVHIIGGVAAEIRQHYDQLLTRYEISHLYRFTGDIAYQKAMRAQVQADYLLLIVDTGVTSSGVIPGKLFEYVSARRPIFALADSGATKDIIERARIGTVVPPESVQACKAALESSLLRPVPETLEADWDYLSQFERRSISRRLGALLQGLRVSGD